MELFGFEFKRKQQIDIAPSFTPKEQDDGAVTVAAGGSYGTYVDLDGSVRTEAELVTKYREMALQPECDSAIDEIVNESMSIDEETIVDISLDNVKLSDNIKKALRDEFHNCLNLLDFNKHAYDIYRRWYIDGRLYYHVIIDDKNIREGIKEVRYVDPRKIRKVREIAKKRINAGSSGAGDAAITKTVNEYFIFNDKGFSFGNKATGPATTGLRIAKDSIVHVTSGLTDNQGTLVLSYLHKSIKALNQLRTLEDALVIYRLARAPERRIWYIDTGNLPKMKAEQYVRDIMVKHKNRLIYDASTGEVRDDRKFMCYALDTKIPLLDGRTLTLQEIMDEFNAGKKNWVYSCDPVTGKFVPGPVSWAGITKRDSQVVRVTFDNGKSIVCTPDHKFPVWNKGLVEAKDLVGQSVIPGYRRMKKMYGTDSEYEQIYKNDTQNWEFTHREVAKWKDENDLREEMMHLSKYAMEDKKTIHHKDYKRLNNEPSNLVMMNRYDHIKYHADGARYSFKRPNRSEDFTPEWRANLSRAAKVRKPRCKSWKIKTPAGEELILENLSAFCRENGLNRSNIKGDRGSKKFYAEQLRNHKAVSVEWLDDRIDVGCLTVDLEETYHSHHTYLLDAGVYTKNTMLEDYWLPRREGGRGTEVTTLPGGQTLGQMDDVLYFQKKFLQCLNVPVSRLNSDALYSIGRATEITRDELKFTRFIIRLRGKFTHLFNKMLEKQLILKGIMTIEDWHAIETDIKYDFSKDNYFTELKDNEIAQGRVELARNFQDMAGKYYSHEWIRKNILQQSDEDLKKMDREIKEENSANDPRWVNPAIEQNIQLVNQIQQQQAMMQQQAGQQPGQPGAQPGQDQGAQQDDGQDPAQKLEALRQAQIFIQQMKNRGVNNRSMQDQSKYKAAVQLIAKNKDFIDQHMPSGKGAKAASAAVAAGQPKQ